MAIFGLGLFHEIAAQKEMKMLLASISRRPGIPPAAGFRPAKSHLFKELAPDSNWGRDSLPCPLWICLLCFEFI